MWFSESFGFSITKEKYLYTRMHSSRMRTGRSLTVSCSLLPGGGGWGGAWSGGVCSQGGSWSGGWHLVRGCAWSGGVPGLGGAWSGGGGVCLVQWGGVSGLGGYPSMH